VHQGRHALPRKRGDGNGLVAELLEVVGRVRRAGGNGALTLRCDSGFFSKYVVQACQDLDVRYSITVRQTPVITRAIEQVAEGSWTEIDYTIGGEA
jgi:hypothetical protein